MKDKKITISCELTYIISLVLLALSVAMIALSDFGLSMIVASAFMVSEKLGFLTFGQSEYIVQALLFIILCVVMKRVKLVYFSSFLTGVIYGTILDLWQAIPFFNTDITPPDSINIGVRIVLFIVGMVMTSFSISLCFKTYLYPQVYDFFVKGVTERYNIDRAKFKTCFDLSFFAISVALTFLFFGKLVGINFGTLIMAVTNGSIIGFFNKLLDKHFKFKPTFKNFSKYFEI